MRTYRPYEISALQRIFNKLTAYADVLLLQCGIAGYENEWALRLSQRHLHNHPTGDSFLNFYCVLGEYCNAVGSYFTLSAGEEHFLQNSFYPYTADKVVKESVLSFPIKNGIIPDEPVVYKKSYIFINYSDAKFMSPFSVQQNSK